MSMDPIGFIGMGTMGLPMAVNLQKAGFQLLVYNRTPGKTDVLVENGSLVASSPAEVARSSSIVLTMLTSDSAVQEILIGPNGVAENARPGTLVIDCSTISAQTSAQLAQTLAKRGIDMLDAPVSGSRPQAEGGVLTFMVGGKRERFDACQPLWNAMGKHAFYMGESGSGSHAKLAINTMLAINLLSLTEGMTLATKAGLNPETFAQVVAAGGARSGVAENKSARIIDRAFDAQFMVDLLYKDLTLASQLATDLALPLPVLAAVRNLLQMTIAKGYGREDMTAVIKCYEEWAGVEVKRP